MEFVFAFIAARYIEHQRNRWQAVGSPLTSRVHHQFAPYFAAEDLLRVRIVENAKLPIPDPPGYRHLRKFSRLNWPGPEQVAAMTFDHVVIARQEAWDSLLFHELVHVTQFRILGIRRFAQLYMRGFFQTRSYENIPLEASAFELEARYTREQKPFNVEREVRRLLAA